MPIKTKLLLYCGAIGCPFFVLVFIILGSTRRGYDPFRHPVSSLSIGPGGWIQVGNFLLTGLLVLAFSIGLKQRLKILPGKAWEPLLIGLASLGLIASGFFSSDPVYGYPPDQPFITSQFTLHGKLHIIFSLLVFIGLPLACFVFRNRFIKAGKRGWAGYSLFSGIAMIVTFILAGIGFEQILWLADFAGLFQRLCIVAGWTWMTLIAILLMKGDSFRPIGK